jgi:hypothetical protein
MPSVPFVQVEQSGTVEVHFGVLLLLVFIFLFAMLVPQLLMFVLLPPS